MQGRTILSEARNYKDFRMFPFQERVSPVRYKSSKAPPNGERFRNHPAQLFRPRVQPSHIETSYHPTSRLVLTLSHPKAFQGHRQSGQGSHANAYHLELIELGCQTEKPAEETAACLGCHAIENRCDGCHTRHRFFTSEARKPNSCAVCHSGPEQYEYEMYMQSYHGMIFQGEGQTWDWTKPLNAENYVVQTCAYCHMPEGDHNVISTSTVYTFMGTSLVDRGADKYRATRDAWIAVCKDCHSPRFAKDHLEAMSRLFTCS